jgi:Putative Actinobacterial Holin-X, holin superfamily III
MASDMRRDLTPEEEALLRRRLAQPAAAGEPSIAELLGGLIGDAQSLLRREVDLARREVTLEIDKAKQGVTMIGMGAGLSIIGGFLLSLMLVYALQDLIGLALWVSYLIVGALLTIIGGIALRQGTSRMGDIDPVPHATISSVRKDVEWISEQSPSNKT